MLAQYKLRNLTNYEFCIVPNEVYIASMETLVIQCFECLEYPFSLSSMFCIIKSLIIDSYNNVSV